MELMEHWSGTDTTQLYEWIGRQVRLRAHGRSTHPDPTARIDIQGELNDYIEEFVHDSTDAPQGKILHFVLAGSHITTSYWFIDDAALLVDVHSKGDGPTPGPLPGITTEEAEAFGKEIGGMRG